MKLIGREDNFGFYPKEANQKGRIVNKDGSFNIIREGKGTYDTYHKLFSLGWPRFLGIVFSIFLCINMIFAFLFYAIGTHQIDGIDTNASAAHQLAQSFFFSVQTFTTVGYGTLQPSGFGANLLATVVAFIGFFSFTLFTGLALAKFSRPVAKIKFSDVALINPSDPIPTLEFRVINLRANKLYDVKATVILTWIEEDENNALRRKFELLDLERDEIILMPINWTIIHPIHPQSPLFDTDKVHCEQKRVEVLVSLKGFDETYAQEVHANFSYYHDEIIWGAQFNSMYRTQEKTTVLDLDLLSDYHIQT